jgi:hypothetical protein
MDDAPADLTNLSCICRWIPSFSLETVWSCNYDHWLCGDLVWRWFCMRVFAYIALLLVINPFQEGGDSAKVIANDLSRPAACTCAAAPWLVAESDDYLIFAWLANHRARDAVLTWHFLKRRTALCDFQLRLPAFSLSGRIFACLCDCASPVYQRMSFRTFLESYGSSCTAPGPQHRRRPIRM